MNRMQNKVTIVTGAGAGIGRAIATKLAAEGAIVIVTDRDAAAAQETAAGLDAVGFELDVTDIDAVQRVADEVMSTHGRVDALVNNAGWDAAMPFVETDPQLWQKIIDINYVGVLNTSKVVLPLMQEQGYGRIVNLGSDAGRVGSSGEAVYAGAKGAVIAFSKAAAREAARHGVTVNVVCPGPTDTALFASMGGEKLREGLTRAIPMRRLGQPEDVANAVAFFASDEASFITGQTVSVSGGLTMS